MREYGISISLLLIIMKNASFRIIIIIILIVTIGAVFLLKRNKSKLEDNLEEIKQNTGKTGDTELYEIQEGYNNIKIATIKPSIKYKVAFSGMIKNNKPEMQELDSIIEKYHPNFTGIYIVEKDRERFLQYLENVSLSKYIIDSNGYLRIEDKDNQNENDKILEKTINGEKLNIINISSVCYIVDEITGEILDYSFENMDKYQTYEYFEDGDRKIIFMTENRKNQLNDNEIINSVINLLNV